MSLPSLLITCAYFKCSDSKIFLRRELAEKLEKFAKLRVHMAARTLGRFGRVAVRSRLNKFLVCWMRFRLHMIRLHRRHNAVSTIAAAYRSHKQRNQYCSFQRAVVLLQAYQRKCIANDRVRKLRDPYCDMSFQECRALLKSEQAELEKAVTANDFTAAAQMEVKM